mmetsp:Transcript_27267/g.79859  ORF Transcript_27267/g.79859 Transcript_27267/m.79859 type:complete len:689 (-) Transcript_27267:8-2074(-)
MCTADRSCSRVARTAWHPDPLRTSRSPGAVHALPYRALPEAVLALLGGARRERGVLQHAPHLEVALEEAGLVVRDAQREEALALGRACGEVLLDDLLDHLARDAQVVARQPREEVVLDLELEADVHKVQERRSLDVHRRAHRRDVPLVVGPRVRAPLVRVHRPVREHDLHVQDAGDAVRDKDPRDGLRPARHAERDGKDPPKVDADARELGLAVVRAVVLRDQVDEALDVQVPPRERHERVEEEVLVRDEQVGDVVHADPLLVVRVPELGLAEALVRDREHGHQLDVGVVLDGVAHDVVRVVVRLPPAHREAHHAREQRADHVILVKVVRHAAVAEVVADAGELLPEDADQRGAEHVRRARLEAEREVEAAQPQQRVPRKHLAVVAHVGLEQAAAEQLLPDAAEVGDVGPDDDLARRHLADQEAGQHRAVDARRVVVSEDVGAVLAGEVDHRPHAARMLVDEARHVVDALVDDDPRVVAVAVLRHLRQRVLLQRALRRRGGRGLGGRLRLERDQLRVAGRVCVRSGAAVAVHGGRLGLRRGGHEIQAARIAGVRERPARPLEDDRLRRLCAADVHGRQAAHAVVLAEGDGGVGGELDRLVFEPLRKQELPRKREGSRRGPEPQQQGVERLVLQPHAAAHVEPPPPVSGGDGDASREAQHLEPEPEGAAADHEQSARQDGGKAAPCCKR